MPEVMSMKLAFSASSNSILAEVDATHEYVDADGVKKTGVLVGPPLPAREFTLEQLAARQPKLAADLRAWLDAMHPVIRDWTKEDVATPEKIVAAAAQVAKDRQAIRAEQQKHADFMAKAREDQERAENAAQATLDQHAAVQAALKEKLAAIAAADAALAERAGLLQKTDESPVTQGEQASGA